MTMVMVTAIQSIALHKIVYYRKPQYRIKENSERFRVPYELKMQIFIIYWNFLVEKEALQFLK